jgi:hypothetical protein
MKKPVYAVLAAALLAGYFCASCSNPWMEKILDPLFNDNDTVYAIGDTGPGGGTVFYYDPGGFLNTYTNTVCHYLEVSPFTDEFSSAGWGAYGYDVAGTQDGLGCGRKNTQIIVAYLTGLSETGKAAQLCDDLASNGYNDWFLPSIDELTWMYTYRTHLDGYNSSGWYLSSSQFDSNNVWSLFFAIGAPSSSTLKNNNTFYVRAIRAF